MPIPPPLAPFVPTERDLPGVVAPEGMYIRREVAYPESHSDGSFSLTSSGKGFGAPGLYFTVHGAKDVWARYVQRMRETIRVYPSSVDEVRADHTLMLRGAIFLRLHYRLCRRLEAKSHARSVEREPSTLAS
jgi:hypothetical protein